MRQDSLLKIHLMARNGVIGRSALTTGIVYKKSS